MKECSRCKEVKPLNQFYKRAKNKDGYQTYCKACNTEYYRNWQGFSEERKQRYADWKKRRSAENREKLVAYLEEHPCVDCGNADYRVLEFDHITDDKVAGVATMVARGATWENILKEIEKCEVRCLNCHRLVTGARGNWWWAA